MRWHLPALRNRYTYATLWAVALQALLAGLAVPTGLAEALAATVFAAIVTETFLIDWLSA